MKRSGLPRQNPKARLPKWFARSTGGKCFYCGTPTYGGIEHQRDWLFLSGASQSVREHTTPTIRGGTNERGNLVLSCRGCNHRKGAFTIDEFRFVTALECGDLNFRFAFETPLVDRRDWLLCHSQSAAKALAMHNVVGIDAAYALRNGWARGPQRRVSA